MTYKQLEDEVIAEFDALTFSLELNEVQHYPICEKEKHAGELCGCEVSALYEKQKTFLRTALRRAAEEGAKSGMIEEKGIGYENGQKYPIFRKHKKSGR